MRSHLKVLVSMGLAAGLTAGCQSMGQSKTTTFDETRLAGMNESQLREVRQAEMELEESRQNVEASKRAKTESERAVEMAKSEQDVLKAEHEQAKSRAKIAKERGEIASVDEAPEVQSSKQLVDAAEKKVKYLESLRDARNEQVKLMEKQVSLAEARVDQAGFMALQENNPEQARAIEERPADFQAKVARAQSEVSSAQADVSRMKSQAQGRYEEWLQMERQIGQQGRQALAPPPSPQTLEQMPGKGQQQMQQPGQRQPMQQQDQMQQEQMQEDMWQEEQMEDDTMSP